MNYPIKIIMLACLHTTLANAQEPSGYIPLEKRPEMIKLNQWRGLGQNGHPITDQVVQEFCDYLRNNPVSDDSRDASSIGSDKALVAIGLYGHCKDANQKKKIVEVMLDMLKRIQVVRDTLGVNPLSTTESYLYEEPPLPPIEEAAANQKDEIDHGQRRLNEMTARTNRLAKKIDNLECIYSMFYRMLTRMKVPLEGIPAKLERSPSEKARTKEFLEKRAAERGLLPAPAATPPTPAPAGTEK